MRHLTPFRILIFGILTLISPHIYGQMGFRVNLMAKGGIYSPASNHERYIKDRIQDYNLPLDFNLGYSKGLELRFSTPDSSSLEIFYGLCYINQTSTSSTEYIYPDKDRWNILETDMLYTQHDLGLNFGLKYSFLRRHRFSIYSYFYASIIVPLAYSIEVDQILKDEPSGKYKQYHLYKRVYSKETINRGDNQVSMGVSQSVHFGFNPGIGCKVRLGKRLALHSEIGFTYEIGEEESPLSSPYTEKLYYRKGYSFFLNLGASMTF